MYKSLIFTLFLVGLNLGALAQDFKIDINQLTTEIQRSSDESDKFSIVFWMPSVFWTAIIQNDPSIDEEEAGEFFETFDEFSVFAVVDGSIGMFGSVKYTDEEKVRESIVVTDFENKSYTPLADSLISEDVKMVLAIMNPMFANMLGAMGENFNFYVFPKISSINDNISNVEQRTSFAINVVNESFTFQLPLASTLKPKKCPVDQEEMSGGWFFCPYHGKELH